MTKIAIIILSDINTTESLGKVSNAFMLASEAIENGDDLKIIFEGTGAKWIKVLEKKDHLLNPLYSEIKNNITGVCDYCSEVFGVKEEIEKAGLPLISEYKRHPSLRSLFVDGYNVITF